MLAYERKPGYGRFVGRVSIDDKEGWHGSIVVRLFAGTAMLAESPVLRGGDSPWSVDVRLPDDRDGRGGPLKLVIDGTPDGIDWDLTDWIDAGFVRGREVR